jgi:proline iminopeptidase
MKSIKSMKFPTSDGQILHVEESGTPSGIPTLFLHGGPGASIGQNYQWPFNSNEHRLIAFDQRGCGRSQPFGSLENNTTYKIIDDIEALRIYLNIEKWLIFGGSWGSTLGLAYSIAHPNRVSGLVLRGIFLGRREDSDWFVSSNQGASQVYPKEYADFINIFDGHNPKGETKPQSLCEWYFEQLTHADESVRNQAATRWFNWEGSISKLIPLDTPAIQYASKQQAYSLALLECYYLLNDCFLPQNYLLENAHKLLDIPLHIVHGRYDMVCKCKSAFELHQALPQSTLTIIEDAGHSMSEKGTGEALVSALAQMTMRLKQK